MTLGQVFEQAARRDPAGESKGLPLKDGPMRYSELVVDGRFQIKLTSKFDPDAYIECSIPENGLESEKNYGRVQFLSMVFKAAMAGMKRRKNVPNEVPPPWVAKIFEYCQTKAISPIALIQTHRKWEDLHKD